MKYLFKFKIRGQWFWTHARTMSEAVADVSKQIGEDIEGYGMEIFVKNIDGSALDQATYEKIMWS